MIPAFRLVNEDGIIGVFEKFAILPGQRRLAPQPLADDGDLPSRHLPIQDETDEDSEKPHNRQGKNDW